MPRIPKSLSYLNDWYSTTIEGYRIFCRRPDQSEDALYVYHAVKRSRGLIHEAGKGLDGTTYSLHLDGKHYEYILDVKHKFLVYYGTRS